MSDEEDRSMSDGERDQEGLSVRGGGSWRSPSAHLEMETPLISYQRRYAVWPDDQVTEALQPSQPSTPSAERAAPVERARVVREDRPRGRCDAVSQNLLSVYDSTLGFSQLAQPDPVPTYFSRFNEGLLDAVGVDTSRNGYVSSPLLRGAIEERRRTTSME